MIKGSSRNIGGRLIETIRPEGAGLVQLTGGENDRARERERGGGGGVVRKRFTAHATQTTQSVELAPSRDRSETTQRPRHNNSGTGVTEYTKRDYSSLPRHFFFSSSSRPKARHLSAFPKLCSCCSLGFQFRFCWLGEDTMLLAASQIAQARRSVAAPRCWYHFLPTRSEQEWKRWFLCYTRNTHNVCACVCVRARVCVGCCKCRRRHRGAGKDWMLFPSPILF